MKRKESGSTKQLLTQNSSDSITAIPFQIKEGRHSNDELIEQAAKGP